MLGKKNLEYNPSNYSEIEQLKSSRFSRKIEPLFKTISKSLTLKKKNKHHKYNYLQQLLLNLIRNDRFKIYTAVHINQTHYARIPARYRHDYFTYCNVTDVLNQLELNGWINKIKGSYNRNTKVGIPTRIRPSKKLLNAMQQISQYSIEPDRPQELIELRTIVTGDKHLTDYNDTAITKVMRADLELCSGVREKSTITLNNVPLQLLNDCKKDIGRFLINDQSSSSISNGKVDSVQLRCGYLIRKFNGNFTTGGRFYSGLESNLPRDLRPYLFIDGQPTVELDYSGFHIRMLYHLNKEVLGGDPYDIENNKPSLREVYKDVALVSINSKGNKAIKGIRSCLVKNSKKKLLTDIKDKTIQTLIDNFKRRHKRIKNHFFSGIGVTLQYKDSQIANAIIKHFAIKGILCMCVHDSFIVPKQYEKELRKQMRTAYKSEMGYYPVIKKK